MIKRFCDVCGSEIVDGNMADSVDCRGRVSGVINYKPHTVGVEVIVGVDGVKNAGEVCKWCILDAVQRVVGYRNKNV